MKTQITYFGVATEGGGALGGRQHTSDRGQQRTPRDVEIIEVLLVAQQHRVDRADFLDGHRRRHDLREQVAGAFTFFGPLGVKTWIGQQAEGADLDQVRGGTEVRDLCFHKATSSCWFGEEKRQGVIPRRTSPVI